MPKHSNFFRCNEIHIFHIYYNSVIINNQVEYCYSNLDISNQPLGNYALNMGELFFI